jgi:hypothetical protein
MNLLSGIKDATMLEVLRQFFEVCKAGTEGEAGTAEGTNPNTIQFATAFDFFINGKWYAKGITDNVAMTALAVQAVDTRCKYLVYITPTATVGIAKGVAVRKYSLTKSTLAFDAIRKQLLSSDGGLGYFRVGDLVTISGFTDGDNNQTFTVEAATDNYLQFVEAGMAYEAEGDAVTLIVDCVIPDLPRGTAPVAQMLVTTDSNTTFTSGTDDITTFTNAGGAVAFTDLACMPII